MMEHRYAPEATHHWGAPSVKGVPEDDHYYDTYRHYDDSQFDELAHKPWYHDEYDYDHSDYRSPHEQEESHWYDKYAERDAMTEYDNYT